MILDLNPINKWPPLKYGLIISMYYLDNKHHRLAHIHVKYQGYEAVLQIPDGLLLDGFLPEGKLKIVRAWSEIHSEDLMADWELAVNGQNVFKIDPLK